MVWSFNMLLFSRISKVLDISEAEIARRCGMTQQALNRYTSADIMLSVQKLLKICNAMRMPTYYFVSEDNHHIVPDRETATIPLDHWHPITWDKQAVELIFGDRKGQIFWKDVAEAMGVTSQKPHDRFLLRKRFPVSDFLQTCNKLNLSPFQFLIDPNRTIPAKRKHGSNMPGGSGVGKAALPSPYSADIAALCRKIDSLSESVADLTQKYHSLLSAHEALARRVQVNIQNVHNSHIGINDNPAADACIDIAGDGEEY